MSIEIYEEAQSISLKILKLYDYMTKLPSIEYIIFEKYGKCTVAKHTLYYKFGYESDNKDSYNDIMTRAVITNDYYSDKNETYVENTFIVLGRNKQILIRDNIRKTVIEPIFSEALDFQLSTQLDDNELLIYYIFCFLNYDKNINGLIHKNITADIIDELIDACEQELGIQ